MLFLFFPLFFSRRVPFVPDDNHPAAGDGLASSVASGEARLHLSGVARFSAGCGLVGFPVRTGRDAAVALNLTKNLSSTS